MPFYADIPSNSPNSSGVLIAEWRNKGRRWCEAVVGESGSSSRQLLCREAVLFQSHPFLTIHPYHPSISHFVKSRMVGKR